MSKDFYSILGVDKAASKEEIKSAYRKLAMQWHPDRNKSKDSEEKFKEISEAYAGLSDESKRSEYNQFGADTFRGRHSQDENFRSANFDDLFKEFGFGGGVFSNFFSQSDEDEGENLQGSISISLEEVAFGTSKDFTYQRYGKCSACKGTGNQYGKSLETCSACNGNGRTQRIMNTPFGRISSVGICSKCKGKGRIITYPCQVCHASGKQLKTETVKVTVPAGIEQGMQLRLVGKGNSGLDSDGDLYLSVEVLPHKYFVRKDSDLLYETQISFAQAALGSNIEIPTLNGTQKITVESGCQPNDVIRLKGKGLPSIDNRHFGDLLIKLKLNVPKKLSKKQIELLEEFDKEAAKHKSDKKIFGIF